MIILHHPTASHAALDEELMKLCLEKENLCSEQVSNKKDIVAMECKV